ncbi:unnamed protein product [Tenebrio molitor]|nr:unnamed protein product [Tenebrio molitor]
MKSYLLSYFLIIVVLFICEVSSEWISFQEYFTYKYYDKMVGANVISPRANCEANTIQIIPGDCRPVYYKVIFVL